MTKKKKPTGIELKHIIKRSPYTPRDVAEWLNVEREYMYQLFKKPKQITDQQVEILQDKGLLQPDNSPTDYSNIGQSNNKTNVEQPGPTAQTKNTLTVPGLMKMLEESNAREKKLLEHIEFLEEDAKVKNKTTNVLLDLVAKKSDS